MVAETLPADEVELLVGTAATKEAIMRALPNATHAHFACHAHAAILDQALEASLSLSYGDELTATEILELNDFAPRLVAASACETAVIQGYETADESLALGTVFIGAGAAGVVATLWAVDDYATALLMSRFYELLAADGDSRYGCPAKALRQTQLWLRDLTVDAEELYLNTHPMLRRHRDSSRGRGHDHSNNRPFTRQTIWAPFILTGA